MAFWTTQGMLLRELRMMPNKLRVVNRIDADISFLPGTVTFLPAAGPPAPVFSVSSGVIHMSIANATGMTGVVNLVTIRVVSRTASSGLLYLYALDVSGIDGSSLTGQTQSTRVPVVFR